VLWEGVFRVGVCALSAGQRVTRCPEFSAHTTAWNTCCHNTALI